MSFDFYGAIKFLKKIKIKNTVSQGKKMRENQYTFYKITSPKKENKIYLVHKIYHFSEFTAEQ